MAEIQSEENALLGDFVELSLYNQDGQVKALLLFDAVLGDQGHICSLSSIKALLCGAGLHFTFICVMCPL